MRIRDIVHNYYKIKKYNRYSYSLEKDLANLLNNQLNLELSVCLTLKVIFLVFLLIQVHKPHFMSTNSTSHAVYLLL